MRRYVRLWWTTFRLELAKDLEYRLNFALHLLSHFLFTLAPIIMASLIYSNTLGFEGWNYYEFLLFVGVNTFVWGVGDVGMFKIVSRVMNDVENGVFDRILVRPYNSLILLVTTTIDFDGIPNFISGIVVCVYAMMHLDVTLQGIAMLAILLLLAILALYAFTIFVASLSFIFVRTFGLWSIIEIANEYSNYPLTIYGPALRAILTFIIPAGIVAFYPASALLGRISWIVVGELAIYAFGLLGLAILFWGYAMKKYSSAGG